MKEVREKKKKNHVCEIKGGSPDFPIDLDKYNFTEGMGFFHKIRRGNIIQQLKLDVRYFESFSSEGKYNIAMLPSTCVINKKLMHFVTGYRNYLAKKLCKESTENAGFTVPAANHVIKTFPFILDNPDVCEKFLDEWHNNVVKKMPKASQKNLKFMTDKAEAYISRMYLVRYSDKFKVEEGKEYISAAGDEITMKSREDLIKHALNIDMPGVSFRPKVRLEAITTFKPFNIRELELDVFDSQNTRVDYYQNEFEQKGLKRKSKSRNRDDRDERKYDRDDRKYDRDDRKYDRDDRKYDRDDRKYDRDYDRDERKYDREDRKYDRDDREDRKFDTDERKYDKDDRLSRGSRRGSKYGKDLHDDRGKENDRSREISKYLRILFPSHNIYIYRQT